MNVVEITCSEDCEPPPWFALFHTVVAHILANMSLMAVELSVLLCGVATIRSLNARYRERDMPTDVLTFPQYERGYEYARARNGVTDQYDNLGDIVIALPVAAQYAREHTSGELQEVVHLTIHGALHLLGFNHASHGESDNDCMLMTQQWVYRRIRHHIPTPDIKSALHTGT